MLSQEAESVKDVEAVLEMDNNLSVTPAHVSIPRKASLFRVVMERKLGIDWEHTQRSSDKQPESLQTNQVQDGYAEL
jgi:hypothetical protein